MTAIREDQHHTVSGTRPLIATLLIAAGLTALTVVLPLSVLGQIGTTFHTSGAVLNWAVIPGTVIGAVACGILPALARRWGQRTMLVTALGLLTIGGVLCAIAPNIEVLIAGRVIGAFSFGALPLSMAVARTNLTGRRLGLVLGWIAAAQGLAVGVGFVLGGLITDTAQVSWRIVFLVLAALGAAGAAAAARFVPAHRRTEDDAERVDWMGGLLLVAGLILVLVPLSMGPTWGWTHASVIAPLCAGVVVAIGWWLWEDRTPRPMVDTHALRDREFLFGAAIFMIAAALAWITNFSIPAFAEVPRETGFGYDALWGGLVTIPMCVGITVAGAATGVLSRRVAPRVLCAMAFAIITTDMLLLVFLHGSAWQLWAWPGMFGIGYGLASASAYEIFMKALRPEQVSTAAGIGQVAGAVGSALASAGITAVLTSQEITVGTRPVPNLHSFQLGWLSGAALAVVGVVVVLTKRTTRPSRDGAVGQPSSDSTAQEAIAN
ncbi:MFS transporter [Streptomyces sp. NPDC055144]